MSTAVTTTKPSALNAMASRLNVDQDKLLATLRNTVFKGATNEELMALVVVANAHLFNPFTKEIYAFPAKGGGIVPVISIDGWISLMNRQPRFDGIEFEWEMDGQKPVSCTAVISVKERSKPIKVTEYFDECYRKTEPWEKMPKRMLRHKALIQGARVAFGISGLYDEDEARDFADLKRAKVESVETVESTPAEDPFAGMRGEASGIAPNSDPKPETPPEPKPTAKSRSKPVVHQQETRVESIIRQLNEANVPYEDLALYLINHCGYQDADSYDTFESLPEEAFSNLDDKKLAEVIKKYGVQK